MGHIGKQVELDGAAFIHETAFMFGKISIGKGSSVFPFVVMRAETHEIQIGQRTNIQEYVMVHVGDYTPTMVGDDCSLSTGVTLRGCELGDNCLVGINATVMDGAKIGANSIVAGHAFVDKNASFEANSVIAGIPATKIGERDNSGTTKLNAKIYETVAGNYAKGVERLSDEQINDILTGTNIRP